jgi:hypothetical protein
VKIEQTGPNTLMYRMEPGDRLCLTDRDGERLTDFQILPDSRQLTFADLPERLWDGYYVGVRRPYSDKLAWWGSVGNWGSGGIAVKGGGSITLVFPTPVEEPDAPAASASPRRRWWRRE